MFKNMCKLLKINKVQTTAYHPESNGALERSHRTLTEYLRHYINDQTGCDEVVATVCDIYIQYDPAYCNRIYTFELVYGHQATLLSALFKPPKLSNTIRTMTNAQELRERLRTANRIVRENLKEEKQKVMEYHDKKAREIEF